MPLLLVLDQNIHTDIAPKGYSHRLGIDWAEFGSPDALESLERDGCIQKLTDFRSYECVLLPNKEIEERSITERRKSASSFFFFFFKIRTKKSILFWLNSLKSLMSFGWEVSIGLPWLKFSYVLCHWKHFYGREILDKLNYSRYCGCFII